METLQVIRWQHLGGHSWGCNRPNALMAILGRWGKMSHEQKNKKEPYIPWVSWLFHRDPYLMVLGNNPHITGVVVHPVLCTLNNQSFLHCSKEASGWKISTNPPSLRDESFQRTLWGWRPFSYHLKGSDFSKTLYRDYLFFIQEIAVQVKNLLTQLPVGLWCHGHLPSPECYISKLCMLFVLQICHYAT